MINRYSVIQFHVMLEGELIVNMVIVDVPEEGTLPMPDQPVQE
jgi:hypothetical protein